MASADASPKLVNDEATNEEESSTVFAPTWGHYLNLCKMMFDVANRKARFPGELQGLMLKCDVTATEKVDGSNLAMWIRYNAKMGDDKKDPSSWEVLLLQGRSAPLWKKDGFEINPSEIEEGDEKQKDETELTREQLRTSAQNDMKKLTTLPGYGNAGQLQQLVVKMRDFCVRVANLIGVEEIEIFGEAFRAKKTVTQANAKKEMKKFEQAALKASWHPFGFKLPPSALASLPTSAFPGFTKLNRLTSATHKLFRDAVDHSIVPSPLPKNHAEFMDMLTDPANSKDFIVCPPPIYVSKTPLAEAVVDTLGPLLLGATEATFEGVFLVHEEGWFGCKFKTGTHDEQGKLPAPEELGLVIDDSDADQKKVDGVAAALGSTEEAKVPVPITDKKIIAAYETMVKIFKSRIVVDKSVVKSKPPPDPASDAKKAVDSKISADVEKATLREFSKRLSFTHVERGQRQSIIDSLVAPVVKEVLEIYEESEQEMPYTEEQLKTKAPNFIKALVLKYPFTPAAGAEDATKKKNEDDDDQ